MKRRTRKAVRRATRAVALAASFVVAEVVGDFASSRLADASRRRGKKRKKQKNG